MSEAVSAFASSSSPSSPPSPTTSSGSTPAQVSVPHYFYMTGSSRNKPTACVPIASSMRLYQLVHVAFSKNSKLSNHGQPPLRHAIHQRRLWQMLQVTFAGCDDVQELAQQPVLAVIEARAPLKSIQKEQGARRRLQPHAPHHPSISSPDPRATSGRSCSTTSRSPKPPTSQPPSPQRKRRIPSRQPDLESRIPLTDQHNQLQYHQQRDRPRPKQPSTVLPKIQH
eukprot:m.20297 g.20297  ORF g.20297 m.20297 type:complete len:225 (-) comp8851_c0_seq1:66-740(-)